MNRKSWSVEMCPIWGRQSDQTKKGQQVPLQNENWRRITCPLSPNIYQTESDTRKRPLECIWEDAGCGELSEWVSSRSSETLGQRSGKVQASQGCVLWGRSLQSRMWWSISVLDTFPLTKVSSTNTNSKHGTVCVCVRACACMSALNVYARMCLK